MEKTMDDPLRALIEKAQEAVAAMTPEQRAAMWEAQKQSFIRAEMAFGSDADEAEYAAAIHSGDPERIAEVKRKESERLAVFDALPPPPTVGETNG
jgi:hypothetical protein